MRLWHQLSDEESERGHSHAIGLAVEEIINGDLELEEDMADPAAKKEFNKAIKTLKRLKDEDAKFDFVMHSPALMHVVEHLAHQMLSRAVFVDPDDFLIFPDEYIESDEQHREHCEACREEFEAEEKGELPALPGKKGHKHSVN